MTTITTPTLLAVPFRYDERGTIRVSGTRVTLDVLMTAYLQGETPEAIHDDFSVVPLADIYAVIAYYLAHQAEVEAYLAEGRAIAAYWQERIEASYTPEQRAQHADHARRIEKYRREHRQSFFDTIDRLADLEPRLSAKEVEAEIRAAHTGRS